jgi:hypothetical protein
METGDIIEPDVNLVPIDIYGDRISISYSFEDCKSCHKQQLHSTLLK